jgi:hypothetical protein
MRAQFPTDIEINLLSTFGRYLASAGSLSMGST